MFTSTEARRLLNVDAKTFLKWLEKDGIEPQVDKSDNRIKLFTYEQVARLAELHGRFLPSSRPPEPPGPTIDERIAALEKRIETLERTIEELRSSKGQARRHSGDQPARRATAHEAKQEDEQETLASFAERHNIAKTTYKRHAEQIGAYKKQNIWYLDEASKRAFYAKFHDSKSFKPCPDCPH